MADAGSILVINCGSTSVKYALFDGDLVEQDRGSATDFGDVLGRHPAPAVVAHRIVHGGARHRAPELLTDDLREDLGRLANLAPDHTPHALTIIDENRVRLPGAPIVCCFDTAFHATLSERARLFPLPRHYAQAGVLRFGFHGLSCEWVAEHLRGLDPAHAGGRAIVAHLGGGASVTALVEGVSVDTTMGFTPTGGIPMATRPGDLDPGIILWLMREEKLDVDGLEDLLERRSGLAGLSGGEKDMRVLLKRRGQDTAAADAVAIFCQRAAQAILAMAVSAGGLDTLVFTGGIGEHTPAIRAEICAALALAGVRLDQARNEAGEALISPEGAAIAVRVIAANEEAPMARHARDLLAKG